MLAQKGGGHRARRWTAFHLAGSGIDYSAVFE
jgi:hypothetical protein